MAFDLVTVGKILESAREKKGLTLEQVSEALCLRRNVVQALESADWDALPHAVYVKGYVTDYARYLDVYESVVPYVSFERETAKIIPLDAQLEGLKRKVRERRERPHLKKVALAGSSLVVLIVTLIMFFSGQRETSLPPLYENVTRHSAESQASWTGAESKKLMIACQERTWVRVVIDDMEKREVMLNAEEVVVFTAKDRFDLLIGNAGGVKLFYNGKEAKFAGASGEVKRVTLP
jgi:transcriptional regulator with XRE-family HTH domain